MLKSQLIERLYEQLKDEQKTRLKAQNPGIKDPQLDEAVKEWARKTHLKPELIEKVVNVVLGEIGDALAQGDRVELRGFGAFSVRKRDARKGRNPRTGEPVKVPAKAVPFFKAGKELRARVNGGSDPEAR